MKWIERKAREGTAALPSPEELAASRAVGAEVIDISELLRRSVQQTAKERGKGGGKKGQVSGRKSRQKETAK
jgi:non-homologous end joining protein Ku